MTITLRPFPEGFDDEESGLRAILDLDESAFGEATGESLDVPHIEVLERDRTVLAWDAEQVVGVASAYSLDLSTPGRSVPTAGVTWVGVRPTHRRQGAMRAMLDHLHRQASDRGEPVAALWAAQPAIYQRFGYGVATRLMRTVVPRVAGAFFRAPVDPSLRLQMVLPADDRPLTQPVYDAVRRSRPGFPSLSERWHRRIVEDLPAHREGASPLRTVVALDDSGPRGYVRYSMRPRWTDGVDDGTIQVRHMLATDPAASAALWRYVIDFELSGRVTGWSFPVDDPVQHWLEDPRSGTRQVEDQLYVKLLDVGAALSRRTFTTPVDVVLDIHDDDITENSGRWRVGGDAAGVSCERTTDAPDLTMDVRSLAAAYLGGPTFLDHQAAGWVEEHTRGAASAASAAFQHTPAPFSPYVF